MPRILQPCGTFAAYKRHLRNDETPCEACKQAARDQKMGRVDGDRDVRKVSVLTLAPQFAEPVDSTPLEDARENLAIVKAALLEAVPREVAALSKRRQELVQTIAELSGTKEMSLKDELAAIRDRRTTA